MSSGHHVSSLFLSILMLVDVDLKGLEVGMSGKVEHFGEISIPPTRLQSAGERTVLTPNPRSLLNLKPKT